MCEVYNKNMRKNGEKLHFDLLLDLNHQPYTLTLAQGKSTTASLGFLRANTHWTSTTYVWRKWFVYFIVLNQC